MEIFSNAPLRVTREDVRAATRRDRENGLDEHDLAYWLGVSRLDRWFAAASRYFE
jgi:hypothetical protein